VDKVIQLRKTLGLRVNGADLPYPVTSFAHFNFDDALMKIIRKSDYVQPTPIQSQAVPAALAGRDIIGKLKIFKKNLFLNSFFKLILIIHRYCQNW